MATEVPGKNQPTKHIYMRVFFHKFLPEADCFSRARKDHMTLPKLVTDEINGMSILAKRVQFITVNHAEEEWIPEKNFSFRKKKGGMIIE